MIILEDVQLQLSDFRPGKGKASHFKSYDHYELTNFFLCVDMARGDTDKAARKRKRELPRKVLEKKKAAAAAAWVELKAQKQA